MKTREVRDTVYVFVRLSYVHLVVRSLFILPFTLILVFAGQAVGLYAFFPFSVSVFMVTFLVFHPTISFPIRSPALVAAHDSIHSHRVDFVRFLTSVAPMWLRDVTSRVSHSYGPSI